MDDATPAVELLERAIGYTRGALAGVRPELLCKPTPCSRWRLGTLLEHMADSLDALTEASSGYVPVSPAPRTTSPADPAHPGDRVALLKVKACSLLGAWSSPAARSVLVGDRDLDARLLVGAGALEIVVHGWDVGQATGAGAEIPDALARALLPVAAAVIADADRGVRFAPAVACDGGPGLELLGFCGRRPLSQQESHP